MELFLTSESYGTASALWLLLCKEFNKNLEWLKSADYGDELTSICIVSIIMPDSYYEDGGYRERILFKKSSKEADVRLRIDYKDFVSASYGKRKQLYCEHIVQALNSIRDRISKNFELDALIDDVVVSVLAKHNNT